MVLNQQIKCYQVFGNQTETVWLMINRKKLAVVFLTIFKEAEIWFFFSVCVYSSYIFIYTADSYSKHSCIWIYRETQSLGQQMLNATVGINGLLMIISLASLISNHSFARSLGHYVLYFLFWIQWYFLQFFISINGNSITNMTASNNYQLCFTQS